MSHTLLHAVEIRTKPEEQTDQTPPLSKPHDSSCLCCSNPRARPHRILRDPLDSSEYQSAVETTGEWSNFQ